MRVALLANLKKNAPTWPGIAADRWDELDSEKTVEAIAAALQSRGHTVTFLEGTPTLASDLAKLRPEICFNLCEGHFGDAREAQIPALLEMLRIPYTGSQVLALALALDKPMTKRVLAYHQLPTPAFQVFEDRHEPLHPSLHYPLFVKPSREGTGIGVSAASIVADEKALRHQIQQTLDRYQQPALVEQYIEGREVTVGLVGNLSHPRAAAAPWAGLHLFPALEIDLDSHPAEEAGLYTNRMKVELAHAFRYLCPAPLPDRLVELLHRYTAAAFQAIGCRDVCRVDFRLDRHDNDQPYLLEINPLPGLAPNYSDLCLEAAAEGWHYETLINRILDEAIARYGLETA
ncbi:MAG: D-alanine--D-alanine ligase family protein [Caldilinea sp.]|jgi:D-alanine-D-alanine ligase